MSSRLLPCAECHRHVRVSAKECPFCGAARSTEARVEPSPALVSGRLGSVAVMTFRAAALGVALNSCGGDVEKPKPSAHGGSSATGGANATTGGTGTPPDTGTGGTTAAGGSTSSGGLQVGGSLQSGGGPDQNSGGAVPIYRATPRG